MPHRRLLLSDFRPLGVASLALRRTSQKTSSVCLLFFLIYQMRGFSAPRFALLCFTPFKIVTEVDKGYSCASLGRYCPSIRSLQATLAHHLQVGKHSRGPPAVHTFSLQVVKQFSCTAKTWLGSWNQRGKEGRVLEISFQSHWQCVRGGVCVCLCLCARAIMQASARLRARTRCSGCLLDVGARRSWLVSGVMTTYRGQPSVWYSAAQWGIIAVTSSGTPCALLRWGLRPELRHNFVENNDEIISKRSAKSPASQASHGFRCINHLRSRSANTTIRVSHQYLLTGSAASILILFLFNLNCKRLSMTMLW